MTSAHQVVAAYWAAAEARDWARFADLLAEHVVYEAPQTRERVRGRAAYLRFNIERLSQLAPGQSTSPRPPTTFQDYLDQHDIKRLRSWRAVS